MHDINLKLYENTILNTVIIHYILKLYERTILKHM